MTVTYQELLKQAQKHFTNSSDAEYFVQALLNKPRYEIFTTQPIQDNQIISQFYNLLRQYQPEMPVQYLVNKAYFLSYELYVDPRVLIPRFETEELVVKTAQKVNNPQLIIDIGTGSGAIAIALAHLFPQAKIIATDISQDALDVARNNIDKYHLRNRIVFCRCDLFPNYISLKGKVDLIISNPPYVSEDEIETLPLCVKNYEPLIALNGGKDGFETIRRIIDNAPHYLSPKGLLSLEIDPRQVELIKAMKVSVKFETDNQGLIRYAFITYKN
ncbi:MAG: peptide chain release factor N(5)-glutamine methyltransferase [candidate division WOR-3 bacterium]|nr:peptide chain release factor N(5)-glutamine methyltransferase [candidate division WOR-3 bacterium]